MKPLVTILKPKKFDLILLDCPWPYHGSGTKMGAAAKHYSLMTQRDICSLDLKSILKKNAMVLVWATGPRLDLAIEAIKSWGLHYRGMSFVWVKTRKDGTIIHGQGVPPTFTKPTTEVVLCATTCRAGRPLPLLKFNTPQVILAPRAGHSTKPEKVREQIEMTLGGKIDKLEIFARTIVPAWEAIGNHLTGEDVSISIGKLNGSIPIVSSPLLTLTDQESTDQEKHIVSLSQGDHF